MTAHGPLVICDVVYAEVAGNWNDKLALDRFLSVARIRLSQTSVEALHVAGVRWRRYSKSRMSLLVCQSCGGANRATCLHCARPIQTRQHLVADFLIGAHALLHSNRLLTRDRGYYRTYFPELTLAPI